MLPSGKLLGGQYRDGVRTYWTRTPQDMLDPASCREFAAELKSHPFGITAVKSDADPFPPEVRPAIPRTRPRLGWPSPDSQGSGTHCEGTCQLAQALGEDTDIAVHCHWNFDWIDALELARAVEPVKLMWLEDPMPPDYSESWNKLTAASPVADPYRREPLPATGFEAVHSESGLPHYSD